MAAWARRGAACPRFSAAVARKGGFQCRADASDEASADGPPLKIFLFMVHTLSRQLAFRGVRKGWLAAFRR